MLISIILKGLTDDFDNFVTICKFSKDEQHLDSMKRNLVNFEYDKDNVAMMSVGDLLFWQ